MMKFRSSILACAGLFAISSYPAVAAVDDYSIEPSQRLKISLDFCSAESQLAVRGDASTDLDFEVTDPNGDVLLSDAGIDDYISLVLANEGGDCAQFSLNVSNLGEEENNFTVVLTPVVAGSTRVKKFLIEGEATETHSFKACGTSARVSARGDGDTDLDFVIRNSDGGIVHEDAGTSDETIVELEGLLSDCETFEIEVTNLGNVYNALMLVVEPEGALPNQFAGTLPSTSLAQTLAANGGEPVTVVAEQSGPGTYRVAANSKLLIDLAVCGIQRLEVRGNGASDLDFIVSNSAGEEVHSDIDSSDVTFKSLEASDACENYGLSVNNVGDSENAIDVALIDPATRTGDIGEGEYLISSKTSTKVALQVCALTKISARGGGETDLDFEVTDGAGSSVHSNYDLSDATEFTIDPDGNCKDYQISVNNLGNADNTLTIAFGENGDANDPRKRAGPFVAGPTGPTSGIARPGQIAGFRKGMGSPSVENRNISLLNSTGEPLQSLYWSNSATVGWGEDRLGESALAINQQWNIQVSDGSDACLFDFRAITASEREIEVGQVNVCDQSIVTFE